MRVDLAASRAVWREWLTQARPGPVGGLRRPTWLKRPLRPVEAAFRAPDAGEAPPAS